jgi:serine/threonine protein kinase
MSEKEKLSNSDARLDEEKLANGLVSRGLMTNEEVKKHAPDGTLGAEGYLKKLSSVGLLTKAQAERAQLDLTLLVGQQIPGYVMLEKLGQGAMGVVYKALQTRLNRHVAIKLLKGKKTNDAGFFAQLEREARLAAKLSHNNIVQAIDIGSAGKFHYFVMELIDGKTIQDEMKAGKKRYEEKEAIEIILQIAQALDHASKRGLVHRDIKPANIVMTSDGIAKLADLGMARENTDEAANTREKGMIIGTPNYIAPEQVQGKSDIDTRADIYSLGGTLYHMVTGQPPFVGNTVMEVLKMHEKAELVPPDHLNDSLSAGLGEVVEMMMAKDRNMRYGSPEALIKDLECLINDMPPKLARQKMSSSLAALSEGEEEHDHIHEAELPQWVMITLASLGTLLFISLVVNIVLIMRR